MVKLKAKCKHCGAQMQQTYTKNGVIVLFCPNTPASRVRTGIGMMQHMEIYCHTKVGRVGVIDQKTSGIYEYEKEAKLFGTIEALREAFTSLTENSGVTYEDFEKSVYNTVSEDKLLEYANLSILLICRASDIGINELPKLFNASMKLGYALGIPTREAVKALAIGVGRQSRFVLDNIGITVKAKEAYAWFKETRPSEKFDPIKAWQLYAIKLITEKAALLKVTAKQIRRFQQIEAKHITDRKEIGKKAMEGA